MPSITGTRIISDARLILQDPSGVRYTDAELLEWINAGQREVCIYKPDASNKTALMTLAAGTKQSLPSDGSEVLEVQRNYDAVGNLPGAAIRRISMQLMDDHKPLWHTDTPTTTVKHVMFDTRTPRLFYVWPPSTGVTKVELSYCTPPVDLAAATDTITIDDIYSNALTNYAVYRALSKETELADSAQRATAFWQLFSGGLGLKKTTDTEQATNVKG